MPLYNFAVVVDDVSMAITHVIRAEEHLSNTPRQLLLFAALGAAVPQFAHLPMLLGPGRRKLSKREAATALRQYREAGYLPEAVLNFLALLGWSDPDGREFMSAAELCDRFSLDRVGRAAGVFDAERLRWMNREYLRRTAPEALWPALRPFLVQAGGDLPGGADEARLRDAAWHLREEAGDLVELAQVLLPFWPGPAPAPEPEAAKTLAGETAEPSLRAAYSALSELEGSEWSRSRVAEALHALPPALGLGPGKVFRPLRAALTGRTSGPELALIVWLLGRDLTLARVGAKGPLQRRPGSAYNQGIGEDREE
jgi:nondiscriminating glutamyl-tRNA synthetase